MAPCSFGKLLRCFLLVICVGAIFLTLNSHSVQKFSTEIRSHLMKGFLNPKPVYPFNASSYTGEYGGSHTDTVTNVTIAITPLPTTTPGDHANSDFVTATEEKGSAIEERGSYSVIANYIPAALQTPYNSTVTLCTQGTYDFLYHVSTLCTRWDGPLSVAVYAPGDDFSSAVNTINRLRQCGPPCVRLNVTWHLFYDTSYPPPNNTAIPKRTISCQENVTIRSSFKKEKKLIYPINVARNVARVNAKTHYVFPSDIELYPSVHIIERFMKMVDSENGTGPHVYAFPVFEVKSGLEPPETKSELVKLVKGNKAVFFHKYICDVCQRFPNREGWLKVLPPNDSLGIFHITKRDKKLSSWEPIYIGTKAEPSYDERLSWEGKRDKMSQMYQLCLMNYDIYIVDNAFLVHASGIKAGRSIAEDHKRRVPYVIRNNRIFSKIIKELKNKYPNNTNC